MSWKKLPKPKRKKLEDLATEKLMPLVHEYLGKHHDEHRVLECHWFDPEKKVPWAARFARISFTDTFSLSFSNQYTPRIFQEESPSYLRHNPEPPEYSLHYEDFGNDVLKQITKHADQLLSLEEFGIRIPSHPDLEVLKHFAEAFCDKKHLKQLTIELFDIQHWNVFMEMTWPHLETLTVDIYPTFRTPEGQFFD